VATTPYDQVLNDLKGTQRDAATALIDLFKQYGLESLAGKIIDYVKQGFSTDTMAVMLQQTAEYKKRFAGNELRQKAGLSVLSPAEYIATERQYRQVMSNAGMPKGFYDQTSDFEKFIGNDMSPAELNDRVKSWQDVAQSDQATTDSLRRLYGMSTSDYAAYLMDPQRALPVLQAQARAVTFAGAASRHGYTIDKGLAEQYGGGAYDVSAQDAEKGFSAIQEVQGDTQKLASIYNLGSYGVKEAAAEVFGGDAEQAKKRKKAASAERATFSDSSRGATGSANRASF
jgi:hypothetical protein